MPPKAAAASKKAEQKKKEKIIEDKTQARLEAERAAAKKKSEIDDLKDLNKLLKPVTEMPKVAK
uniref:Uncharacterized protein n=1 Tax=Parascaris equorum TaxID=6256 RepID=A0A914RJF4_PAREQ